MQVILLQDVPNVGKKFQEVEVANGYGTNYLIPNGLAQVATEATRNRYEAQREKAEKERQKEREALAKAIEEINGAKVVITVDKAGDQGQLFAGIYPKDIAEAVNNEFSIDITGSDIDRDQPINKIGDEEIEISILDTTVKVTVNVEATSHNVEDPDEEDLTPSSDEDDQVTESEEGEEVESEEEN